MSSLSIPLRGYASAEIAHMNMAQTIQNNTIYNDGTPIASTLLPNSGANSQTPTPKPPIVTTSRPAQIEGAKYSSELMQALAKYNVQGSQAKPGDEIDVTTYSDPYTQMLDRVAQTSSNATKALIASIKAKSMQNQASTESNYENYKRGLQLLGIQHNQAQFTPDLLAGQVTSVEAEKQQKLQQLDMEETKALMDAEDAQAKNDLSTLKSKMEYVKQIREEKKNALKDLYEQMYYEQKIADIQAEQLYDKLQGMSADAKESFLVEAAKTLNIPVLSLVKSLNDVRDARAKKAEVSGGGYTSQELRKLRQAGIDPKNIEEEADDFLYGKEEKVTKPSFYDRLAQVIESKPKFDDGTPYFYEDELTAEGFKRIAAGAAKSGVSKIDLIKKVKPYLRTRKADLRAYGITNNEADAAGL